MKYKILFKQFWGMVTNRILFTQIFKLIVGWVAFKICPNIISGLTCSSKSHTFKINTDKSNLNFTPVFFAPFFLWLRAGWYTLHCLRNKGYFIIFSTHIYIGSISSCFACTEVYQSPLGLWPTAAIQNYICPSNHFLSVLDQKYFCRNKVNFPFSHKSWIGLK